MNAPSGESSPKRSSTPASPVIGIDLGMTSVIAARVPAPGEPPAVLALERGQPALPAVVSYRPGQPPVVGRAALDLLTTAPTYTVTGIKRLLGRKADSQAVRDLAARVGYAVMPNAAGDAVVSLDGREVTPDAVASLVLAEVRAYAEQELGCPVRQAVVAVPAYFTEIQKNAVRAAGKAAGLEVIKLVHEPTAVALAYGYNTAGDARVVIVDMGGVRLDISVMEITGNVFDVVATGGDAYLGGADVDARLVQWILQGVEKKFGKDLTTVPPLLMKVRTAAEQAKRELSRFRAVDLQIPMEVGARGDRSKIAQLRLERTTLERLAVDLISRLITLLAHVLKERGLSKGDIDDVILVGGATRIPILRRSIAKFFGKEPVSSLPPEQVIAFGAALLADSLSRTAPTDVEVLEEPIGIALSDGRYMRIIDKDSKLPITRRVMIPTTRDNQRLVEVDLFQGDADELIDAEYLGSIAFPDVAEAKAGDSKLVVDLVLSPERVLSVTSPEPERAHQTFEFPTRGHASRAEDAAEPAFYVGCRVKTAASESA